MRKFKITASWILAITAVLAIAYNTITITVVARTDIKYIKEDIKEIKNLLFSRLLADSNPKDTNKRYR